MEQILLKDFLEYKFLNHVKVSPDGKSVVFGVAVCDEESNSYHSNLFVWKDGNCRPLTQSNRDADGIFLDKDTFLFKSSRDENVRKRMENGEEVTCFYRISLNGGEAEKSFEVPLNVSKIEMLNEDHFLLQASYDKDYSIVGREEQKEELLKAKKEAKDYEVFTKIPFCHNGGGYTKNTVSRLFVYDAAENKLKAISPETVNVICFDVKKDKSEVVIVAENDGQKVTLRAGLYTYHFETNEWVEHIKEDQYSIDGAYYFKDQILFIGNKEWPYGCNENGRFYLLNEENQISLFFDNQDSLWNSVGSDCRYGSGTLFKVEGNKFYFINIKNNDCVLLSIDTEGIVRNEVLLDGSVDCFDVVDDTLVYVALKDGKLQEVYKKDEVDQQLTWLNQEVHKNKYIASYQEILFENDGVDFKGWVLLPKDYDPNEKYPAILDIHGGPKTVYGKTFYHEMQVWANLGYFVFFTNPRGSDGRGNEFTDIFGKYGTIDYEDVMKFTDVVLEKYPAIDPKRVGVTGGSYGGFMTNWIIGHTNRFACAATQRSISNWLSFYGTSDIGSFFAEDQIRGNIFDSPEVMWQQSPIKYAGNIETPTLFIHADEDYRCPLEQGLQLYTAMIDRGIEARFVMFHGENHELSRSGLPKHRVRRLEEITSWMETHLK